jgi:hypothetical protein
VGLDVSPQPIEAEPYALVVSSAQEQLADGESPMPVADLRARLRERRKKGGALAPQPRSRGRRSGQLGVLASYVASGTPRLRRHHQGFAPDLRARGPELLRWLGRQHWARNQHAVYTTRLDYALRRITPERVVTPETTDARDPQLIGTDTSLSALHGRARERVPDLRAELDARRPRQHPRHAC